MNKGTKNREQVAKERRQEKRDVKQVCGRGDCQDKNHREGSSLARLLNAPQREGGRSTAG